MIQKTKPFKAVSMPCTQEQFKEELSHILAFLGVNLKEFDSWDACEIIVTNFANKEGCAGSGVIETAEKNNRKFYPKFCPQTFIEALGYDYEDVLKEMGNPGLCIDHSSTEYIVLRPILWFHKDQKVAVADLEKYFTKKAIGLLIESNFIK